MSDFYCNQKFWWLTVNLENLHAHSCCAATPQKINLDWLRRNPGQMFNSPELINDRRLMLDNQPAPSCASACWIPESNGIQSRRLLEDGTVRSHSSLESDVEVVNITVGRDCNLTCVYCCKFYSSAWARDIVNNSYPVTVSNDSFTVTPVDLILNKVSQKDLTTSPSRQLLVDEIHKLYQSSKLKEVRISGGEPFLYLELASLVQNINNNMVDINIHTGLGVDEKRFKKELAKLPKNVTIYVSAESVGDLYEFVRYGNTWTRFENNLNELKSQGFKYVFKTTISNLTLLGLPEFMDYIGTDPVIHGVCTDPNFLSLEVLDNVTKSWLDFSKLPEFVKDSVDKDPSTEQVNNFKAYINEFSQRRSLDLKIFPQSMIDWIKT